MYELISDGTPVVCPLLRQRMETWMYELIKRDGLAKRGRLHTVHGVVETPVFMNVGTAAAIKGAVSTRGSANRSEPRWSCPILTISMCARGTR